MRVKDRSYIDRLKSGVMSNVDIAGMSEWIIANTSHPKDESKPWSFKGHEFQIDILNDPTNYVPISKCSQVGVSEIFARWVLGILAILSRSTAIYTLPTYGQVKDFSPLRLEPIIEASPYLTELLSKDVDNSGMKRIGDSHLLVRGAFTQRSAISTPAGILVNDEVNFSDPVAMTTFISRLGHEADGGLHRLFSTPTVFGYGISAALEETDRRRYGVRCYSCHEMVFPIFMDDVKIPGFDETLENFDRDDLSNPSYKIKESYLSCPKCRAEITQNNLLDVSTREWVPEFPDKEHHGYQVYPFEAPGIKTPYRVLKDLKTYKRRADWVNFAIGDAFEDGDTSFLQDSMDHSPVSLVITPRPNAAEGCVMGIDVGKTSNIVIGKPLGRGRVDLVWAERVRQTGEGALLQRINELHEWFGVAIGVIDAGPDFTTAMAYSQGNLIGEAYACYYTRAMSVNSLSHLTTNDEEAIIKAVRTESLNQLAKMVNARRMGIPIHPEMPVLKQHLRALKKVKNYNQSGEEVVNWVNTGPDHYGHALNYMNMAAELVEIGDTGFVGIPVLPDMHIVQQKQEKLHITGIRV